MSHSAIPLLSVIIPIFNNSRAMEPALDSVLKQNIPLEIIAVDDCSTDDSVQTIEKWRIKHPDANLALVRLPGHRFAHFARIEGIRQAKANNIAFLDADDNFTGNGCLARALQAKIDAGADMAHFRSLGRESGEMSGELVWAAPLCEHVLHGQEIFRQFTERPYPPWTVWGKIFSHSLLLNILPVLEQVSLHGAEDAFMTALAFANAKSYLGFGEYGYIYSVPQTWPMSRFARRAQGMLLFAPLLARELRIGGVDKSLIDAFLRKLEAVHAVLDAGRLATQMETRLFNGERPEALLREITPYASEEQLFAALLLAGKSNSDRLVTIVRRYFGFENLDG